MQARPMTSIPTCRWTRISVEGPDGRDTIRPGQTGSLVQTLQRSLELAPTGVFDAKLEATVRVFQRVHALVADGIVGPATWDQLQPQAKVSQRPTFARDEHPMRASDS